MRAPLRELGRGPQRRLADQPAALLRRAVPGLVPARRRRRARPRPTRSSPTRRRCRSTRRPTCPPGFDRGPARPARRLHRRPRRHGHLGDVVADPADRRRLGRRPRPVRRASSRWTCARRRTTSSAPGCSPPSCARTTSSAPAVDATPRSPAGSSTPTARRCRSRRATSSRPMALLEQYGADAVRYWAASGRPGTDTAVRRGQMKVGRRLAIKMLNASQVRARARRRPADLPTVAGHRAARPGACSPRWPRVVDEATAAFDGYDYARALERTETLLLVVLRRLPRAGQGPRLRRPATPARRVGAGRAGAGARRCCCGCSRRSCRSSPRRSGRGGRTARCTARRGRPRPSCRPGATRRCSTVAGEALAGVRKAKSDAKAVDAGRRRRRRR